MKVTRANLKEIIQEELSGMDEGILQKGLDWVKGALDPQKAENLKRIQAEVLPLLDELQQDLTDVTKARQYLGPPSYPRPFSYEDFQQFRKDVKQAVAAFTNLLQNPNNYSTEDLEIILKAVVGTVHERGEIPDDWAGPVADVFRSLVDIYEKAWDAHAEEQKFLRYLDSPQRAKDDARDRARERERQDRASRETRAHQDKIDRGWTTDPGTGELTPPTRAGSTRSGGSMSRGAGRGMASRIGDLPAGVAGRTSPWNESKMKVTKSQLKQIIREELEAALDEAPYHSGLGSYAPRGPAWKRDTETERTDKGNITQATREKHATVGKDKFPIFDKKSAKAAIDLRGHTSKANRKKIINRAAKYAPAAAKKARKADKK